ncbi:MAG: tRNA glutamyl-Q(34) synthetase GluQRS [Amphiplicatus sp.]
MITRFAPSPTGLLHLGHAFSALTAWRAARAAGGRFLLRIEDIDQTRCKPEFEAAIFEDLAWLGLDWERPVRRQSEHFDDYAAALDRLRAMGLVYRCFKTRAEVTAAIASAPHDGPGPMQAFNGPLFTGAALSEKEEAARIAAGEPFAWRLSLEAARARLGAAFDPDAENFGDVVIARKDAGASYHLASVHDDALAGVTHVIRGEDLESAAALHRVLQALLGYPTPVYRHHRLITDEAGKRLAKRDKALTIRALRESGAKPGDLIAQLGL